MLIEFNLFSILLTTIIFSAILYQYRRRRREDALPRWAAREKLRLMEFKGILYSDSPFLRNKHGDGQPYFIRAEDEHGAIREGYVLVGDPAFDFFNEYVTVIWEGDESDAFEYKYEPEGEGGTSPDLDAGALAPPELAHRWLDIFYNKGDIDALEPLLAPDLIFRGPFLECDSAETYLDSLREDPPRDMSFEILREFQEDQTVCVIYRFRKGATETTMVQIFECAEHRIRRIELIFNAAAFS